ncbi:hypothetical protein HYH03_015943 [Edaphochlamys debaryana]|uniref:UDP-3-O-acyl-N-acetylglucosamine deacetylase n=1 Tax=Edaphochlamys debaryana TaxID=47281 RepID=A0A835XJJ5_9CHLO|nr:hypothetical protein HYH03_015943 [Edaphochlamys debaryana]|eukprot:KAG2485268.1 hypothetical protein HYH03_015943 [Edaphochlamys debaryana]
MEVKRTRLAIDKSPEVIEGADVPLLPMPTEYQQTLWASFTVSGIGLHTGETACVRVRPAFAGEGRYFVRVPQGTNAARAALEMGLGLEDEDEAGAEAGEGEDEAGMTDAEYRQMTLDAYSDYLTAMDQQGFNASFMDYLETEGYADLIQKLRDEGPPRYVFSDPEAPQPRGEDEDMVPAHASALVEPNPVNMSLGSETMTVMTVEALLSALEACGVDNARIEVEGGDEVPTIDGSAEGWVERICASGLCPAPARADLPVWGADRPTGQTDGPWARLQAEKAQARAAAGGAEGEDEGEGEEAELPGVRKLVLRPKEVVSVHRGASFITLYPEDTFRLTAGLDRHVEAPVIGKQWKSWAMWEDMHYKHALAEARSFVSSPEQAMGLRDAGWLQGGTEGCVLIAYGERWYDDELVRFDDEPVRYQIQSLIGALSLLARDGHSGLPLGHIVSYDADAELAAAFVAKLAETAREEDWVPIVDVTGPSEEIDYQELMAEVLGEGGAGEGEAGEDEGAGIGAGEGEFEEGEQGAAGGLEAEDEEGDGEFEEFEEGEEEEAEDDSIIDVEAEDLDPRGKGRGGKARR